MTRCLIVASLLIIMGLTNVLYTSCILDRTQSFVLLELFVFVIKYDTYKQRLESCVIGVLTCAVELQGRQDLCRLQLHSERRHVKTSTVYLCTHTLQEHRPGSADQIHQSVLQGGEKLNKTGISSEEMTFVWCRVGKRTACSLMEMH